MKRLFVFADFDWLENIELVGELSMDSIRGGETYGFKFEPSWLKKHGSVSLSDDLNNYVGMQYTQPGKDIFGCFSDSLPDRWGRTLVLRREQILAAEEKRPVRRLSSMDYLLGIDDATRMGGFRFKESLDGEFINCAHELQIPPIAITDITAGFYFNCIRKSATQVEPQKGIIGVVAGLGIASSAGKELLGGDFEMTVVYDNEKDRLTTFMFTGNMKAVSGLINSNATIVYQEDDIDKYFALNITVDAKADGIGGISEKMTALSDDLADMQKTLNANMKEAVSNASGGLQAAFDDKSNSKADSNPGATMPEKPKVGEVSISLDFRVTMKEKGKKLDKHDREWYRQNAHLVNIPTKLTQEELDRLTPEEIQAGCRLACQTEVLGEFVVLLTNFFFSINHDII